MPDYDLEIGILFTKNWDRKSTIGFFNRSNFNSETLKTRTTNVVRNAGCARSRYTLKFIFNQLMNL